ncbi:hypothetical protein [Nitrincola sp. MINF-07-Sa-05]|uniref:hypothetical protein n=1 Tax=Nitrincola salilacus TaxID=3400273 RepID=UPI003918339E
MPDYSLIVSVLSGIYSASVGYDEEDAIGELKKDLDENVGFRDGFRKELKEAFSDKSISWRDLLAQHEVLFVDDEEVAREYAKRILWDVANPS